MTIDDLLDVMDDTLEDATNLPFTGGKRVVDVEKVRETIDEIRLHMPAEIKQAKKIVSDRGNILAEAKKEAAALVKQAEERAGALVKQAEEKAAQLVDKEAITRAAQQKATEILTHAQEESREVRTSVTAYCEVMLRDLEELMSKNLGDVKTVRSTLRKNPTGNS